MRLCDACNVMTIAAYTNSHDLPSPPLYTQINREGGKSIILRTRSGVGKVMPSNDSPARGSDIPGRPQPSLVGGGGSGRSVSASGRGASFSCGPASLRGASSLHRASSLRSVVPPFGLPSALDAALTPLQSIRVHSSSGGEGETAVKQQAQQVSCLNKTQI